MKPRLVFFGTPTFAERSLEALIISEKYEIPLVVTQPDKPVGRGLEINESAVKLTAKKYQIKIVQPISLKGISSNDNLLSSTDGRSKELVSHLNELQSIDAFIVVAYGKIIPETLLNFPSRGAINIHGSLLPRHRGAAPIQRALAAGDKSTGVCLMQLEAGLDTGPVFSKEELQISPTDDFGILYETMSQVGATLLLRDLPKILSGELQATPQKEVGITVADKWETADLQIKWDEPGTVTQNRIRASSPFPGARTTLKGNLVKIFKAALVCGESSSLAPTGTVLKTDEDGIHVQLPQGEKLIIAEMQFSGKKRMKAADIVRGRGVLEGDRFGN